MLNTNRMKKEESQENKRWNENCYEKRKEM